MRIRVWWVPIATNRYFLDCEKPLMSASDSDSFLPLWNLLDAYFVFLSRN